MSAPTLAAIWETLGTDERLNIWLEQQSGWVAEKAAIAESLEPVSRGRIAGYATALADLMYFVVEGNPLPTVEDLK